MKRSIGNFRLFNAEIAFLRMGLDSHKVVLSRNAFKGASRRFIDSKSKRKMKRFPL